MIQYCLYSHFQVEHTLNNHIYVNKFTASFDRKAEIRSKWVFINIKDQSTN